MAGKIVLCLTRIQEYGNLKVMESSNIAELEKTVGALTKLCQEINPFNPLTENERASLKMLEINPEENPYAITNQLILRLENSIEALENLRRLRQ